MARNSKAVSGWKGSWGENATDWCENLKAGQSVQECIDEHTYNRSSALKDVLWGFDPNNSILSDGFLGEDFTMPWQGKFFSFFAQKTMLCDDDSNMNGTRLSLVLGYGLTYQIFLHDSGFFEMNYRPIFPVVLKTINPGKSDNHYYTLALTEVGERVQEQALSKSWHCQKRGEGGIDPCQDFLRIRNLK